MSTSSYTVAAAIFLIMPGDVDLEAAVHDTDYIFEGRMTLRLCNQVRSAANDSLQMMALTARQLYRQHSALLMGRPLLITPRSLVELSRESARGLTAQEIGSAVQITRFTGESSDPSSPDDSRGHTSKLPSSTRAVAKPHPVQPEVLEACRAAESAHHSLMAAAYGAKRATQLESDWRRKYIESSPQCCTADAGQGDLYGAAGCRQAHRWPAAALRADQRHIFDEIWKVFS